MNLCVRAVNSFTDFEWISYRNGNFFLWFWSKYSDGGLTLLIELKEPVTSSESSRRNPYLLNVLSFCTFEMIRK